MANDTGTTPNPGCRLVRRGLDRLFALTGARRINTLPFGLWAKEFEVLSPHKAQRVRRGTGVFARGTTDIPALDVGEWRRIRDSLMSTDTRFANALDEGDVLVVNGEGSLHHNLPRALALLAMMSIASRRGKQVALLNATVQAMSGELLSEILPAISFCQTRELRSLAEILPVFDAAFAAPDIAVLGLRPIDTPYRGRNVVDGKRCMVSGGVLTDQNALNQIFDHVIRCGFNPWYLAIGDGGDGGATRVCNERNIPVVHGGEMELERLIALISRSALAVSGRHHINILLLRCGVPFVPLFSNTWKIEATLEIAGYPRLPIERPDDLAGELARMYEDRVRLSETASAGFLALTSAVDELPQRFSRCN